MPRNLTEQRESGQFDEGKKAVVAIMSPAVNFGGLSPTSINRRLANALVKLASEELELCEMPIRDSSLCSQDYDADCPPTALALKQAVAEAEGSYIRDMRIQPLYR